MVCNCILWVFMTPKLNEICSWKELVLIVNQGSNTRSSTSEIAFVEISKCFFDKLHYGSPTSEHISTAYISFLVVVTYILAPAILAIDFHSLWKVQTNSICLVLKTVIKTKSRGGRRLIFGCLPEQLRNATLTLLPTMIWDRISK